MGICKAIRSPVKSLQQKIKKLLNVKMTVPYITGLMPNDRMPICHMYVTED